MNLIHGLFNEYKLILVGRIRMKIPIPEEWNTGTKGDVILLPGFSDNFYYLRDIGDALNREGYKIHVIPRFNTVIHKVDRLAARVTNYILTYDLENVILVGHSKGGLVAKYAADHYPSTTGRITKIFTIATPFRGTVFGKLDFFTPLGEFHPENALLEIISKETQNSTKIVNIFPAFDNVIFPKSSLHLDSAAVNVEINFVGHTGILKSSETINQILTHI